MYTTSDLTIKGPTFSELGVHISVTVPNKSSHHFEDSGVLIFEAL